MTAPRNVVVLIGSARHPGSTSWSLGSYLLERLHEKHVKPQLLYIQQSLASRQSSADLISAAAEADLLVWSFPLYADCVPACVMKTMELLAAFRSSSPSPASQQMAAIVNCGFPDVYHTEPALDVCRCFAQDSGYGWLGGLAVCEGDVIIGRPLLSLGRGVKHIISALDISAAALAAAKPIPPEAVSLIAKPIIPAWLYPLYARAGILRWAIKRGGLFHLSDRPFEFENE